MHLSAKTQIFKDSFFETIIHYLISQFIVIHFRNIMGICKKFSKKNLKYSLRSNSSL